MSCFLESDQIESKFITLMPKIGQVLSVVHLSWTAGETKIFVILYSVLRKTDLLMIKVK